MYAAVFSLFLIATLAFAQSAPKPVRLLTENRVDPIGIDVTAPRLSWNLNWPGAMQQAYQVRAASSAALLEHGFADRWNSGKVVSTKTQGIVFGGSALRSRDVVVWQVRVWSSPDSAAPSAWSDPVVWELGLLNPPDWQARWIVHPTWTFGQPMPVFAKEIDVPQPVKKARLYITGLGNYSATINGTAVTNDVLAPGNTDYSKQVEYAVYDVAGLLAQGPNSIKVELGNGIYNSLATPGRFYGILVPAPSPLKLLAQLELTYEDGATAIVASGPDWLTALGPTTWSSWFGGEDYDARIEPAEWSNAAVSTAPATTTQLAWRAAPPVRVFEKISPAAITQMKSGDYMFDMGVNFAGWQQLRVSGPAGTKVTMRIAEILNSDGSLNLQTMGGAPIYDTYTLSGNGVETWHPKFEYHGFRYLQVSGLPSTPTTETITGYVVRGANDVAGSFTSSNTLLNDTHRIINRAIQSNMISIFTDCPDREKLGWLGDMIGIFGSITSNYDISAYIVTIARNMAEGQTDDGLVPTFVPAYADYSIYGEPFRDDPNWGVAMILAPYEAYRTYGDIQILKTYYPQMRKFLGHLTSKSRGNLLDYGLNDWNSPSQTTPTEVIATYGYYRAAQTLSKVALVLGNQPDSDAYSTLADSIAAAFNAKYLNRANHTYAGGQQAAAAMALDMGIVPFDERRAVLDQLVASIRAAGNHVNTGVVSWLAFIRALSAGGRDDVLFDIATQTTSPSYGFQIAQGATSLTESWDGPLAGDSQNHMMFGALDEWFTASLAGIQQVPVGIAYEELVIKPSIVGGLTHVKGSYRTPQGLVESEWSIMPGGELHLGVMIPGNSTATIYLPAAVGGIVTGGEGAQLLRRESNYAVYSAGPGSYEFLTSRPE
jgi:alpha-L-rhamnosidase